MRVKLGDRSCTRMGHSAHSKVSEGIADRGRRSNSARLEKQQRGCGTRLRLCPPALLIYAKPPRTALAIRANEDGLRTAHSLTLITVHPFRLRDWDTRRSLRLFASIFLRQKAVFVRGRYLQEQPCQKQPSTKSSSFLAGQAKSGFPVTGQCLR